MEHISFSQVRMFLRCPRQYEFRYIQGLKLPPSGVMVQSRAWHQTLEKNYRQKITSGSDLPLKDVQDIFSTSYDAIWQEDEVKLEDGEDQGVLKDEGIAITTVHHQKIVPSVQPAEVESMFEVDFGRDLPVRLKGIWDLIDTQEKIVEHKAYSKTPNQDEVNKDLQLTVYAVGYRKEKGKVEGGLRLDVVVKTKKPKVVQLATTRTIAECIWTIKLLERVAKAITKGIFYPQPEGWHCSPRFCGYWEICKKV